jgi:hypothetical protein
MYELTVSWLLLRHLRQHDVGDAVVLALVCPDRTTLAWAWANVLDANVLPSDLLAGELLAVPQHGCVVIFEPAQKLSRKMAEARWPQLVSEVADAASGPVTLSIA